MPRTGGLVLAVLVAVTWAVSAQAATKTVTAGPPVSKAPKGVPRDADTNAFYRKRATIHVGDRVRFQINGFHTVTFPARGDGPPAFIAPQPGNLVAGVLDAAGAPFWFNGQPRLIVNPEGGLPAGGKTVTGSRLTGSGAPLGNGPPKPYTVRFPRKGTFTYYCVIHPGMRGTVSIKPRSRRVPSAGADRRAVKAQFAAAVARVKADDKFAGPSGAAVEAGHDTIATSLLRFFPATKTVKVGQPVTFAMSRHTAETHTVSFGPEAVLGPLAEGFIAPDPASGPGGPPTLVVNPTAAFPSDPPPAQPPLQPALHGNGFFNTGVLDRDPASPVPGSARVVFAQPGTYHFICLIHPFMKGQIVVTP